MTFGLRKYDFTMEEILRVFFPNTDGIDYFLKKIVVRTTGFISIQALVVV